MTDSEYDGGRHAALARGERRGSRGSGHGEQPQGPEGDESRGTREKDKEAARRPAPREPGERGR